MSQSTHHDHLKYLFALKSLTGVGDITATKILNKIESLKWLFNASLQALNTLGLKKTVIEQIRSIDYKQFDPVFEWLAKDNHHAIPLGSAHYPALLSQISSPPLVLFALGNIECLHQPQLAIVGTRSPTPLGLANTRDTVKGLCNAGITITSGLALGIDGEAHRSALVTGGYTVAVVGTGLSRVFPAAHRDLAHQVADKGVIVSECFPDQGVLPGAFPRRNRIIAGLSLGTLVVEAAQKSGSLITARIALEEGREVFAIPGAISNPVARGCHSLIKQGASLVESVDDILEQLPSHHQSRSFATEEESRPPLNDEALEFIKHIDYQTTSTDLIVARSQLSIESVTNLLLLLELDGWLVNTAGGYARI